MWLIDVCFFVWLMVFNATFNNISVKTTDLSQVTNKLYHIMLYTSPWSRFELTTSVEIGTHCIGSCKSNYHTITGADPGFQVRGGALKTIAPSGGRREHFWGISCEKSRFYAKKSYFSPILGGARAGCAPLWIRPWITVTTAPGTNWQNQVNL